MTIQSRFSAFAHSVSRAAGSWQASFAAYAVVIAWTIGGFYFGFSDPVYQLYINSFTTVITFIMVFAIQHTQNKDTSALQLKLDELIRVHERASNQLIALEKRDDKAR